MSETRRDLCTCTFYGLHYIPPDFIDGIMSCVTAMYCTFLSLFFILVLAIFFALFSSHCDREFNCLSARNCLLICAEHILLFHLFIFKTAV